MREIGDEKLGEYVNEFRQMAQADPTLFGKLYSQPHPYNWMTREVDRLRLVRDVGSDPAAYREKILAEGRAQWEAEKAAPAPSPALGMQPSLAGARSVAGRTAGAWTGEPSLDDVLSPVQNRQEDERSRACAVLGAVELSPWSLRAAASRAVLASSAVRKEPR